MIQQSDDEFRVVSWNLDHNGTNSAGVEERWHLAMDVLAEIRPHVLLRQELTRAHMQGGRLIWAEASRLGGHAAFLATANPESANPTGVYIDRDLMEPVQYFEHATQMWHPICNPVVRLKGAHQLLSLGSFHLCSFSPEQRAIEARRLVTLGKPGMAAIIGGDCNSYPHRAAEETTKLPDWSQVEDHSHFQHRTIERDGRRVSDTTPDEILAGQHDGRPPVFVDTAHYAATQLGQPEALAPTASLWRKDQGPRQRIDRVYSTPKVAQALLRFEVIVTDEVIEASDHALTLATYRYSRLLQELSPEAALAA